MAEFLFANNAATTLAAGISDSATSLTVATGTGSLFPSPGAGQQFNVTLIKVSDGSYEIVKVTARSTDTFTIVRAQESTTALAFSTSDKVELRVTAAGLSNMLQDGDVDVTASNTVTLTNKILAAATNVIEARSGPNSSAFSFRNKIIGGDFTTNPWQRGTSFTAPANGAYTADRWSILNSSAAVVNVLKTADAPTAAEAGVFTQHCLHIDVTTADASIAAGDLFRVVHAVEGLNAASFGFGQSGTRYVTLSFWHKHTKTGVYCVQLTNTTGGRVYIAEYTQDVTDTWEKATITVPVATDGTWGYDNGVGIYLTFVLAAGTTYQSTANSWLTSFYTATANQVNALDSTANNFKIALVQLEPGSVATPFETRPYGVELALCQRYYYRIANTGQFGVGYNYSTTLGLHTSTFPVTMRIAPSALEQSGTASHYKIFHGSTSTTCNAVPAFNTSNTQYAEVLMSVASGLTAGQGSMGNIANASGYLGWSAEL